MTDDTDLIWFNWIQKDNEKGLRLLFDRYYVALCRYVRTLIMDETAAEDIVQNVFIYVWEHRQDIQITHSVRTYLFTASRNRAMNHLRDTRRFTRFVPEQHDVAVYEEMSVETDDLHLLIEEAVKILPEKCHRIFQMRCEEDLSYQEIARREGIAEKTVEAHIHTAIQRLKNYLAKMSEYAGLLF